VLLTEFGNERQPKFPDRDTDPLTEGPTSFDGPRHNQIPEPDRATNNSTVWQEDYSPSYFKKLYFGEGDGVESLKTYYEKQSSNRYSVDGTVTGWVRVRYNEARYGRSTDDPNDANGDDPNVCADIVCGNSEILIRDGVAQYVKDQKAAGKTDAQIKKLLAGFDQQDRYDYDGDGDFNEADGYIDHFQIVHAGGDEADGDPIQGEDAIWSHRGYANLAAQGTSGPDTVKLGGFAFGDTGLWIGDYTMQPENGGLSVFAHEYGHDLGLPDLYDTASGGAQPVEFWSLMSQSRLSAAGDQGIGTRPGDLGAWEKMQLGWLDYETAIAGQKRTFDLGPHEYNSAKPQALLTVLPPKTVTTTLPTPPEGDSQWWSGAGDGLDNTLTWNVAFSGGKATLTFKASWNIEDCGDTACDYAYVQVNDGSGWTSVPGSITNPAEGNGIDGTSDGYVPASFDLSAYAGRAVQLRLRYATDGAAQGNDPTKPSGLFVDDINIVSGGINVLSDKAEPGGNGETADGFTKVGASTTTDYPQYYIASNRTYTSYDAYLKTGPYDFGYYPTPAPDKVDHFPYQDGLQVTYWDTSYTNNNVSLHPGNGQILTVDAHPEPLYRIDGQPWRPRVQIYDATFGRQKADSFTLHVQGQPSYVRGQDAVPTFDDTKSYFRAATPLAGVRVRNAGVTLTVEQQEGTSMRVALGTSSPVSADATLASARKAVTSQR
jgi:immune inhibitor A